MKKQYRYRVAGLKQNYIASFNIIQLKLIASNAYKQTDIILSYYWKAIDTGGLSMYEMT